MAEVMKMAVDSLDRRRDRNTNSHSSPRSRMRDHVDHRRRDYHYGDRYYNKRRASPSSQRPRSLSPPPFKRSRRLDTRLGYEHEAGGRSGYFDDRPRGPFAGRLSGGFRSGPSGNSSPGNKLTCSDEFQSINYIDQNCHDVSESFLCRGGYADAANVGSTQREGLMSYKQFIQELEDDILPAEAELRYQEYKSEYVTTQRRAYFDVHKDEEWLKDKYHPTSLLSVIDRRNVHARKAQKEFLLDLRSGTLDINHGAVTSSADKLGQTNDLNSDDEVDAGRKRRRHGRGSAKEFDLSMAPKAHPVTSEPRRVQVDIEQAQTLVRKLDSEKGLEENIPCESGNERTSGDKSHSGSVGPVIMIRGLTSVKGLEGTELLDTLITYLWRVHALDYYGMIETTEAKGLRHIRFEGKSSDVIINGVEWEKKLDSFWQERLKGQDPMEVMAAKETIDAAAGESLDPYVRKIRDEKYGWKYGCGAKGCTKLFRASEFVHKHLKLKHSELVLEVTSKMREDLYFQNYMSDKNAPGGKPIMQQSLPKKPQPHRLGPDNRMKDGRGHRERDKHSNDSERCDRAENHQSVEFRFNNDVQAGSNPGDMMFDTFGRQGMHVGPFHSDIPPPPVLMPVPGTGPLGPFVPAPPEVAVQMYQEQGGPSPFEARGRNARSGPKLGGPAPVIILPPQFRQDPRRVRSYQDLDAPDDEVTVIDYRSL